MVKGMKPFFYGFMVAWSYQIFLERNDIKKYFYKKYLNK